MAHVYAFGLQCPAAKPIIHLGATSCFVGDNTDLIVIYEALGLVEKEAGCGDRKPCGVCRKRIQDMPTLGFTHYQPAQLTTVGKRATLWMQDLLTDLEGHTRDSQRLISCAA